MFFGTFKFEATKENGAILLISTKLVQNYSFKEKILGHFQKEKHWILSIYVQNYHKL